MFEISKEKHFYDICQVCGADKSKSADINIHSIKLMNKHKSGVELHLCSQCCNVLSKLTAEPDKHLYGIKMMSVEELDEFEGLDKTN